MSLRDHLEEFLAHTEHVRNLLARGEDGYQQEFTALKTQSQRYKTEQTYATKAGESDTNIRKNRYKDILPFDYTRVLLTEIDGVPGSDYINASIVKGYSGEKTYIASQGPLPQTVHDFWRLIWECQATVIVMSCNEYEMGKHKCERYWVDEDETKEFNDIVVSMISQRRVHEDFLIRTLKVKKAKEERVINQFHYTAWPDHGVPNSVLPIIEMVKLIREYQPHDDVPLLIHCSAGCGRTGTICVIDYVFNQLKREAITADFSLYEIVQEMRKQRPAMVQTRDQYELVHRAVAAMFNKHLKDTFDDFSRVYENVHLKPPQADQPRMPPGAVGKPQSSPNQQRKRHSDNHSYVNAKPDEPSKVEQESSTSNKFKDFLKKGKDDLKMKREGLKVKTEGLKLGLLGKFVKAPDTPTNVGQTPPTGPPPRLSPQVNQAEIIEKTLRNLDKQPDTPVIYHNHDISFPKQVPKPKGPSQSPPWSDRAPGQMSSVQL